MSQADALIFEISKKSFDTSVLLNSHKLPVVVEFMAVWSEPCIHLEASLVALAKEFAGQFIFAKVDMDEQPELIKEYAVKNVPTLKVFRGGEVVRTEEGLLETDELRQLLKTFGVFRQSDEMRMQARQQHLAGDTIAAVNLLTQAIQQDPSNTRVAMDMVQIMLDIGQLEPAKSLFNRLPDSAKQTDTGRSLIGQLTFQDFASKTAGKDTLLQRIAVNPADYDAHFDLAICLVAEHQYHEAMEHLFNIFNTAPDYKGGAVKEMIINLINMLMPNEPEMAKAFRRRLGGALS